MDFPYLSVICQNIKVIKMDIVVKLGIDVGMKFTDFIEFEEKLKNECASKYVQLSIISSRTVEAARSKIKRYLNPELKFYSVHWACIHGGRQYKCRGKGIRKTRTFRQEELCPAHIRVKISDSGNDIIVSAVNYNHNHLVSEQLFKQLPHNRKFPSDVKDDVKKLQQMKVNRQTLRANFEKRLDKCNKLKELRNLKQLGKKEKTNIKTDLCDKIQSKFGEDCHLLLDDEYVFRGLTFCTKEMISSLSAFPEFICIDATYKLRNINAPLYLILNEDGNGESNVVAVSIFTQEDKESLEWFLQTFKNCNPSCNKIQNVMSDKDLIERETLSKLFPDAQLHICNVLKNFQRDLTCEKFKITSSVRIAILEQLQSLVHSQNEDEFNRILETIKCNFPKKIFTYLSRNWVDIREEWCPFLGNKVNNFMNTTTNVLDGINAKFKATCQKDSTLEQFIDDILTITMSLEKEKNTRRANFLNKRKTTFYLTDDFRSDYSKLLTPYAFKKLETQFSFTNVSFSCDEHLQYYIVKGRNADYSTTTESCTCYFSKSMGMPCKHIFAVRDYCAQNLFQPELVIDRWKNTYFRQHFALLSESNVEVVPKSSQSACVDMLPNENQLTCKEKYKRTFVKAKLIATLAADMCGNSYFRLNDMLDKIVTNLQSNNYDFDIVTNTIVDASTAMDTDDGNIHPINSSSEIIYKQEMENKNYVVKSEYEITIEDNEIVIPSEEVEEIA